MSSHTTLNGMKKDMSNEKHLLIGGEWRPAASGAVYPVVNPANEEIIGQAAQAGPDDVAAAVAAANQGFETWRRVGPWERSKVIRRIAELVAERADAIARLITLEIGKPLAQARAEVQMTVELFDWFADETRRICGQVIEPRTAGVRHQVIFEPVGVVAAFTAWNFPVLLMSRKIAPALAAGCSIICRPAEEAPGAVLTIGQCCLDAGVPPGVINILTGEPSTITPHLMAEPSVRKVTFTGSIPVGKLLIRESAETLKRVTMELGGHAPVIVHDDVDIEMAAQKGVISKFRNAGQVCASPTRFYVHASKVDRFAEAFADQAGRLRLGDGLQADTDMGPLTTERRRDAVESLIEDAVGAGARVLSGGCRPAHLNRGYFYAPTVVRDAPDSCRLMREEPFGPIATITPFDTVEEAITKANGLEFGLTAYVFTHSLKRAHETAEALSAGVVGVNTFTASNAETPFGGVKQSGFGREGGTLGIRDYLNAKLINFELV